MRQLRRVQEKKLKYRSFLFLGASVLLVVFIFKYGLPALLAASTFIANLSKEQTVETPQQQYISAPFMDSQPAATNSSQINISGTSNEGYTVTLYADGEKAGEQLVGKEGTFVFKNIRLGPGDNQFYTVATVDKKMSNPSETITVVSKSEPPKLSIRRPADGDTFRREEKNITIEGETEENVTLTVNGRFTFVDPAGNFTTTYSLSDGKNEVELMAVDEAGNEAIVKLNLNYEP